MNYLATKKKNFIRQSTVRSASGKQAYDQHKHLSGLRVSETNVTGNTSDPASFSETDYKHSSSRGLFHVPVNVFNFFTQLHIAVNSYLTCSHFDAHQGKPSLFAEKRFLTTKLFNSCGHHYSLWMRNNLIRLWSCLTAL